MTGDRCPFLFVLVILVLVLLSTHIERFSVSRMQNFAAVLMKLAVRGPAEFGGDMCHRDIWTQGQMATGISGISQGYSVKACIHH